MEKKITNNRISYMAEIPAEKTGEFTRLVAAAAAVVGESLAGGMRMHADAERMQSSTYWEVTDSDGGTYSVSLKVVKLSQAERMTRTKASSIAATEYASYLVALASNPSAMAMVATKAVAYQSAYADYLLSSLPSGEKRKSATEFFSALASK